MEFVVKKLGWENTAQFANSAKNIYNDLVKNKKQVVVVSAMRSSEFNTTDKLILLWKKLQEKEINKDEIIKLINSIRNFHLWLLEKQILCEKEKEINLINKIFDDFIQDILFFIKTENKKILPTKENDYTIKTKNEEYLSIIWFWEIVSAKIISQVVDSLHFDGICSKSINLWNLVNKEELKNKNNNEIFDLLAEKLTNIILEKIDNNYIPILSGYIWSFPEWIEKAVWRWYSDATAGISAVWLARRWYDVTIEIQKSVKWLLSADPRMLENPQDAVLLKKVNYLIAREITWDSGAQAKLLHPQTLRPEVQQAGIKIHLFDPFSNEEWTWIVDKIENNQKTWIEFIWWRNNVIFFSVSSWKMFERNILARLFTIVSNYFSIDIVSSSETEITFTIDGKWVEDKDIEWEFVEYRKNRALIFCVGENMKNHIWLMSQVVEIFWKNDIDLKIVSQWRLQRAMVFWIKDKYLKKAINLLHNRFIKWQK